MFTFSDPAEVGVIEFPTVAAKIGFYKKIKDMDKSLGNDNEMWFNDNRTFERRARDKALGQMKHLLITKKDQNEEVNQMSKNNGKSRNIIFVGPNTIHFL